MYLVAVTGVEDGVDLRKRGHANYKYRLEIKRGTVAKTNDSQIHPMLSPDPK